jgi:enoyl-[acyl-carrier protein] reductase / trans-2-enoyl-CoA reductase (NAD+)
MIITPKIRNSICMNAHPAGCKQETLNQIEYIKSKGKFDGPRTALVVGSSTGYGLASRISLAFGSGSDTIGVFFEKEGADTRPGTPGYYNNRSLEDAAREAGLKADSINGDAFSHEVKKKVIDLVKEKYGTIDLVVYSLASPVRVDPDTGEMYRSVLKPLKETYSAKSVNAMTGEVSQASIEPAAQDELEATVKVMGGEDWKLWISALKDAEVLSEGAMSVAYSYIGPEVTYAVYREGTIGKAKEHLEKTASEISDLLSHLKGKAFVSVNKALVTRASAVIPVVPLYMSILYKVMKQKGIHEGCIEQMYRLFTEKLYSTGEVPVDDEGRIRVDDWEMRPDVQNEVTTLWEQVDSGNIEEIGDMDGYREDFLRLNGFSVPDVDYDAEVNEF